MADNSTPRNEPAKSSRVSSGDINCTPRRSTLIFLRQYARVVSMSTGLPESLRSFFVN